MKMTTGFYRFCALAGLAAMVFAGCSTASRIESRKKERFAAYQAMSPEFRRALDAGIPMVGMSKDAIYILMGKPAQVLSGGSSAGQTETWVYRSTSMQEIESYGPRLRTGYITSSYTSAQVVFQNGVVKSWQYFARP